MPRIGRFSTLAAALLLTACGGLTGPRIRSLPATPTQPVTQGTLGPMTLERSAPGQPAPGQLDASGQPVAGLENETVEPGVDGDTADGLAGTAQGGNRVAALGTPPADADTSAKLGRSDLLGGWKIASGADQCQLFMNLTSWKGGYRATTRGCTSPALQNISAWDLNGQQVTLKDANGAAIGSVFPTNTGRFSGQTAGGSQLAFFR